MGGVEGRRGPASALFILLAFGKRVGGVSTSFSPDANKLHIFQRWLKGPKARGGEGTRLDRRSRPPVWRYKRGSSRVPQLQLLHLPVSGSQQEAEDGERVAQA